MNFQKRIPFLVLLIACFFAFLPASDASAKEKEPTTGNKVSLVAKDGINLMIDKDVADTLSQSEKEKLIAASLIMLDELEISESNTIISPQAVGKKTVYYKHTCSPSGPYLPDILDYIVTIDEGGVIIGQINYYVCGDMPDTCGYFAGMTILF